MSDDRLHALDTMRRRLCAAVEYLDGAGYTASPLKVAALQAAQRDDGTWADIAYQNDDLKDWDAARHLERVLGLARAWYECPDAGLLRAILRGLDAWYALDPQNPNWWWMMIGAPLLLGETLLRVQDECDSTYITRAVPAFLRHESSHFTGQNLVWTATVTLYHGILTGDPARASQAMLRIGNEVRVLPREEGIQPDMTFFQHELLLYSGGYGQSFVGDVGRLIAIAAGTAYAWPPELVARFSRYVLDGSRWMVRGRTFDPGSVGREITRAGHSAARYLSGLRALASFDHPRRAEAEAALASEPLSGNRHFWCADLMVHRQPDYYLSIRMPSPRVLNADWPCCGGEGRRCHHMADGATFVLRDGDEYRDLYPAWNWRQIPGATVVQAPGELDPETVRGFGECAFAGGASDGAVGCAAMDFARGNLTVRRAWCCFDDGVVALGAGLTCTDDHPVRTTLNQCHWRGRAVLDGVDGPLAAGDYPLAAGAAFHHDSVSYRVLDGAGTLRLGEQSGAWSDCGVGADAVVTLPVLNAGLDHGIRPQDATFAYAISFGRDLPAEILQNTPALQAAWCDGLGHAVFYEPGVVTFPDGQRLAVDRPCIVLYRPSDGRANLTLAHPAQDAGMLDLRLTGPITAHVAVSLPAHEYAGSSISVVIG